MGANFDNLDAANTAFLSEFNQVFTPTMDRPELGIIAKSVTVRGTSMEMPLVSAFPRMRKWVGSKVYKRMRAYKLRKPVEKYEASIVEDALEVDEDLTGGIASRISDFAASGNDMVNALVISEMLTNPTGYDETALFSNSHPHSNGTGDNLVTTALSHVNVRALDAQMRGFEDEHGRPYGIDPDTLIVPPGSKDLALEIAGADKPIYFNASAAEATSSVVDGIVISNVNRGKYQVIVSHEMPSGTWLLVDSKSFGAPMVLGVSKDVTPVTQDAATDHARFDRDEYRWSMEARLAIAPGFWQTVGGKIS